MPSSAPSSTALVARLALLVTLTGLVAVIAFSGRTEDVAVGVLAGSCAVGVLACLSLARRRPRLLPVLAALSCAGVAAPVLYLDSLPADSAVIPLAEVGTLLLSTGVMVAAVFLLPRVRPRSAQPWSGRH